MIVSGAFSVFSDVVYVNGKFYLANTKPPLAWRRFFNRVSWEISTVPTDFIKKVKKLCWRSYPGEFVLGEIGRWRPLVCLLIEQSDCPLLSIIDIIRHIRPKLADPLFSLSFCLSA